MEKKINKNYGILDVMYICAGLFIMGLGSALSYEAQLGTGSIGTLVDGVHNLLSISRGLADMLVSLILMIPAVFFARDLIGIGTLLSLFGIGLSVDFWKWVITMLPVGPGWTAYAMYAAGLVLGSLGTSLYISVGAGISSYDSAIMLLYRIFKSFQYKYVKILADFLMMFMGVLLGGTIGIGTVLSTVAGGFVTQFFLVRCAKWLKKPSPLQRDEAEEAAEISV